MSLAEACKRPFANGTEERAWMSAWCDNCAHDHDMHQPDPNGPGCPLIAGVMLASYDDYPEAWPEAWLPEPDDGQYRLPSRLVCLHFTPCWKCGGDPWGEVARAAEIADTKAYWEVNA